MHAEGRFLAQQQGPVIDEMTLFRGVGRDRDAINARWARDLLERRARVEGKVMLEFEYHGHVVWRLVDPLELVSAGIIPETAVLPPRHLSDNEIAHIARVAAEDGLPLPDWFVEYAAKRSAGSVRRPRARPRRLPYALVVDNLYPLWRVARRQGAYERLRRRYEATGRSLHSLKPSSGRDKRVARLAYPAARARAHVAELHKDRRYSLHGRRERRIFGCPSRSQLEQLWNAAQTHPDLRMLLQAGEQPPRPSAFINAPVIGIGVMRLFDWLAVARDPAFSFADARAIVARVLRHSAER